MAEQNAIIEARSVEKFYSQPDGHRIQVVAATDLAIYPNQFVALLGASGSGKSTLLRILSGLASPSSGEVLWHGVPLSGQIPNVSIVFQSFALFPWLTVRENVEAPLLARGMSLTARRRRALKMLDTVGLDGFETGYPKELSGGMKQRVGFARALVVEPEVLFMDEPFSALDVLTAENLRSELLDLWTEKKIPTQAIFVVTHNIEEAVLLANRVIVLARNPARIRADFEVRLPYPRERKSARFVGLVDYIYKVLTKPDLEHVEPSPIPATADRYPMLPHARPGGISGLLEILQNRADKEDLHQLASDLQLEADDLLPIVEAAQMLGFVRVFEGDVEVLPMGRDFAAADIDLRKKMFRDGALTSVPLLRQITRNLESKGDKTLPQEYFLDILDEHFSEDEAKRQLETALHWGRYAEMFDYDSSKGRLYLSSEIAQSEGQESQEVDETP